MEITTSRRQWLWLTFFLLLCSLLDWVLVALLPRLGLSYGPVWPPVVILILIQTAIFLATAFILNYTSSTSKKTVVITFAGLMQVAIFVLAYDSFYIEPFRLTVTDLPVHSPAFLPNRPLRILQISDLHVERITQRDRDVLAQSKSLQPDIILLTGDYVNSSYANDPLTLQETRWFLSQLHAPYGIFAVNGNVDKPFVMAMLFEGLANIRVLNNEILPLRFPAGTIYLIGVAMGKSSGPDEQAFRTLVADLPPNAYSILLYHTSALTGTARSKGVNLYLSGHTHGGQIRLPIFGGIFADSEYSKKFQMGEYIIGPTTLYVSRGLGMAGGLLPRARFLCPPELVLVELGK